jgi:hypothetical protein
MPFPEGGPMVMSFIKYVGESVRYDLIEGNFVGQIRGLLRQPAETESNLSVSDSGQEVSA